MEKVTGIDLATAIIQRAEQMVAHPVEPDAP
jgi:hypothetical protein